MDYPTLDPGSVRWVAEAGWWILCDVTRKRRGWGAHPILYRNSLAAGNGSPKAHVGGSSVFIPARAMGRCCRGEEADSEIVVGELYSVSMGLRFARRRHGDDRFQAADCCPSMAQQRRGCCTRNCIQEGGETLRSPVACAPLGSLARLIVQRPLIGLPLWPPVVPARRSVKGRLQVERRRASKRRGLVVQ